MTDPTSAAAVELAALARAFDAGLAEAFLRCAEPRMPLLIVEDTPLPKWLDDLPRETPCIALADLPSVPERAVRAERVVMILDAEALLGAKALDQVQWLVACRPARSTAAVLVARRGLGSADRSRLERRAWRTILVSPPPGETSRQLEDYDIFLISEAASGEPPEREKNRAALARWLARAPAPADMCNRLAVTPLLGRLEDTLVSRKAVQPRAFEPAFAPPEVKNRVREHILDRIDRAHDEIEAAIAGETRKYGQVVATEIIDAATVRPSQAVFAAILSDAEAAMRRRIDAIARGAETDLREAIGDDLSDIATSSEAADVRDWLSRHRIFSQMTTQQVPARADQNASAVAADEPDLVGRLLTASIVLAACALPPTRSLITMTALLGAVGLYHSSAVRKAVGQTFAAKPNYETLAEAMRNQLSEGFAVLQDQLVTLRREARKEIIGIFERNATKPRPSGSDLPEARTKLDAILASLKL